MTDKELLELAAKASGIKLEFRRLLWTEGTDYPCYEDTKSVCEAPRYIPVIRWNPLVDDGDAFRLMVALDIDIRFYRKHVDANCDSRAGSIFKEHGKDRAAATRNAIVRAAAEIGRGANKLRQAKGDGMNPKDFFSKYGREQIEIGCPWVTVEEMYQAFKARMMDELCVNLKQAGKIEDDGHSYFVDGELVDKE